MDFNLTEEEKIIKKLARDFADKEIAPFAKTWDEEHFFPIEILKKAALLGLAGITVKTDIGGAGLSRLASALIFEELATACPSTAAYLSIQNMVAGLMDKYANPNLRQQWLPQIINMEKLASYCLTEPNSGSDAASLQTKAERHQDHYLLNGTKAFISGGSVSDLYICMVRTGDQSTKGISCLLIEKNTPGLSFGKKEVKLGWHSQPTTQLFFENCRVPLTHLIGQEGQGFNIALSALNGGRINIASCSLGGAKTCLALTKKHLHERKQFGKKLADFEALQFSFADMVTQLESARLLVHRASVALDQNDSHAPLYCAMAKQVATDNGFQICDQALQLFGGYGYLSDYPIERFFRDLRVHRILEGTNEIMKMIIARNTLAEEFEID